MAIMIDPISPIAFSVFGFDIRWYALAYVAAFIIGYWLMRKMNRATPCPISCSDKDGWDNLLCSLILGVILGGRLGYVLFYNLPFFISHPLEILAVWHGGMSFHGGLLGVIVAVFCFAWVQSGKVKNKSNRKKCVVRGGFCILDLIAVVAPIGLFFGRIANFINMEIMGRPTNSSIGVVFSGAVDQTPRYPSPLFEAALEGILLFIIMILMRQTRLHKYPGAMSGMFGMMYAVLRIIAEQFRQPDIQLGFLTSWGLTMGQLLSACMFVIGASVFLWAILQKINNKKDFR